MKILHVITTINRGGAENHLVNLVEEQLASAEVTVAYLKGNGYWRERFELKGARVVDLGMRRYGDPRSLFRLIGLIGEVEPDLIHAHMPPAELYSRLALLRPGSNSIPMVISKHNDEPFYHAPGSRILARWVAGRADRVIVISEAVKDYMLKEGLVRSPESLIPIHYGIDPSPYESVTDRQVEQIRSNWSVGGQDCLFGTVARMVPQKALDTMLRAFALARTTLGKDAKLVLVGSGPLEKELKALALELGIEDSTIWAGYREDIPAVMNALDVFVLPSRYEGFGLVLLEAMAAGKPVVASRVSAIPEVVEDGLTGVLVPPMHPQALADAFRFFQAREERLRYGQAGRQRVHGSFSVKRMLEKTMETYNSCRPARMSQLVMVS